MVWGFYYCPSENYLRCFGGSEDPLPYTIVHTVFVKNIFLVWFIIFKNFDKIKADLVYLASATIF